MKIIVSCGDINGIGLEAFLKAVPMLYENPKYEASELTLVVNQKTLKEYCSILFPEAIITDTELVINQKRIALINCDNYANVDFGKSAKDSGKLAIESLDKATSLLMQGQYDAIVTLPIAKDVLRNAGWGFIGHTQYFASKCVLAQPLMILFKDALRIAVVTDHIPLMSVGQYLALGDLPLTTAEIFNNTLRVDFDIEAPKIAVLSLNPHAGESGEIGKEEVDLIDWQIKIMNTRNILADGPKAADGFFGFGDYKNYDGILAMYHDQGLIPLKLLANGGGVNFTAGLPIVRTSPDHGTAFSIAGKGVVNPESTYDALVWAVEIAQNRRKNKA